MQCIDWKSELEHLNIDEAVSRFYELIRTLLVNVPRVHRITNKFPCWYSNELIKLINHKSIIKQLHDTKKRNGIDATADYELFSNLRKEVKRLQDQCESSYVSNIEGKLSSNTKCFFSYTKPQRATNSLPNVVHHNDATATDRKSVCDLFAKYFSSVYQRPDHGIVRGNQTSSDFNMSPIEVEEVKLILLKLDQYKVSSPDDVPTIFYKKLSSSISLPLSILFNKSINEGKYPELWKISYVLPTFKSGNRYKVKNYRPISILCEISKIMERIMFNRLYAHVKEHISDRQHGLYQENQSNQIYLNTPTSSSNQLQKADKSILSSQTFQRLLIKFHIICLRKI